MTHAILVLPALLAGCLAPARQDTLITPPPQAPNPLDAIVLDQMANRHIPGLSLAIMKDGSLVKATGYGLANVQLNVPATPETVYQIQSITKSFTATGVMMLVEEGKIDLDAPISKYLDGTPDTWKDIAVRNLLTHTSGIKDFINEPTASLRLDVTEEEVLKAAAPRPLNFRPGETYAYSNTNYHLLAMIIRKVTGKFYGDFLRERIFEPLGMTHTAVISRYDDIPNAAAGYIRKNNVLRNGQFIAPSILGYGGGGIRSTVLDMAKWDAALYTERLLKKASLEQMWTPARLDNGQTLGYGFGWFVATVNGHRRLAHSGGHVTGFSSIIHRYPDDRITIVVFTNLSLADPGRIASRLAECYIPDLAHSASK
ncbi:MAG: beta-lactamase family protein [Phycisphaerae bacterium]|nr:beta-lactamase family protein [Phycisphaerae bacterium]